MAEVGRPDHNPSQSPVRPSQCLLQIVRVVQAPGTQCGVRRAEQASGGTAKAGSRFDHREDREKREMLRRKYEEWHHKEEELRDQNRQQRQRNKEFTTEVHRLQQEMRDKDPLLAPREGDTSERGEVVQLSWEANELRDQISRLELSLRQKDKQLTEEVSRMQQELRQKEADLTGRRA
ncbi:unnamed protein product [Ostreobium quekettii]|uniref:Uncharacterized protein n=1 Tax=Ostreobium quekettii TaxID=121088 RepID=A0A8S1IL59_9CHLO|nr:unnamed protein product [Ostreobium quekettii]|eukprot:evm.model.scf_1243.3 EVM.evm.TU.scf_1243.3   scf_1243:26138-28380(-)